MGERYTNSESKVAYIGYMEVVPNATRQSNNHQCTTKNSTVDKQTGAYTRTSVKESISTGDVYKERSTGRVGYKDEYKTTSTFKVGDKSGFSEYQVEERYRRVDYGSGSSGYYGGNKYLE